MNVDITSDEYRDLLDILHIADVVLSGHRRTPDHRTSRHRGLIQRLYALAPREGLARLMGHDAHRNVYAPTQEFEEASIAHGMIDEFVDHLFWDELISRLSVRDAAQAAGGMDRLSAMSDSDRQAAEAPRRQRYIREFSRNGVANLTVIDRFDVSGQETVRTSD